MKESLLLATQLIYDWATLVMLSLQLPAVCHIVAFLHGNRMIFLLSSKSEFVIYIIADCRYHDFKISVYRSHKSVRPCFNVCKIK